MTILHKPLIVLATAITLLLQGCGMTSHPVGAGQAGQQRRDGALA